MKLIGISGSLREGSYNTKLLLAAAACLPEGVTLEVINIGDVPLYNNDLDKEVKPEPVAKLIQTIGECDGILFATPEYNYSIPGVLKNAIDWASRPAYKSVLAKKPAAIVSCAKSPVGGGRAQMHLRDVFSSTLTSVVPAPPFLVPVAQDKFDQKGNLVDEKIQRGLDRYMNDFVQWVERLSDL